MSAPLEVNDPQALAELTAAFEAYECALVDNDIAALNRMFWDIRRVTGIGPFSRGARRPARHRAQTARRCGLPVARR
jgi:hypothetical protein